MLARLRVIMETSGASVYGGLMMHGSLLRLLGVGCALGMLGLTGACADADDPSGFSITNISNPTQVTSATNPTSESASSTGAGTTGDASTTGESPTGGDESSTTSPATTATTTADDTTTGVDPSTTTNVDPSTTTGDDTTGVMTTMDETTGDPPPPPPPPPKDPQPVAGIYEHCLDNTPCDVPPTNGCFTLTDEAMKVIDGYCTKLCDVVADCGVKPNAPAVQECLVISPDQSVCALKCAAPTDCPTGMACTDTNLGFYCF
jgi:hypothetical protein